MRAISPCNAVGWQAGFLSLLPAVQTHAQIQFRKLPAVTREEATQEAIAAACASYQVLAARGKLDVVKPGTLADFAVKHVRNGRHVGGHQDSARDIMSPVVNRRYGVRIVSCDQKPSSSGCQSWKDLVAMHRKTHIPDLAAFRIDFSQWLTTLTRRDRRIIAALVSGERTTAVADRFRLSAPRISQLRRRYERDWRIFQGEPCAAAASA